MSHAHRLVHHFGGDILRSEGMQREKHFRQHGTVSVYAHSLAVALLCVKIASRLPVKTDTRSLVRGALLHDYFLYDWHDKTALANRQRLHGFHHPLTALRNAEKEYKLNNVQRDIIRKHMWPLSVVPPMCREAWVVTTADKYCSLMETLKLHKGHGKKGGLHAGNL